ncbi:Uncharacterised protein [Mycobacterium tuberculosis]|uniref:Uncharacterized protein n=1 Tax=Mycobacterium tuberculosis TaxID=1773 RepID=A0A0U0RDI6_MYCTX|nr:Uncharacterised protein [Mycobacterium tuberculosis]
MHKVAALPNPVQRLQHAAADDESHHGRRRAVINSNPSGTDSTNGTHSAYGRLKFDT